MKRSIVTGFLALSLVGCGDDDGGASSATESSPSSTGDTDPTTAGMSMTMDPATTDPGTTSTDPGTTSTDPTETPTSTGTDTDEVTGSSTAADESSSGTTGTVEFALTSPAFMEGELFPVTMRWNSGNVSPQLDWVGAPAGTMSFGVFFLDLDNIQPGGVAFPHSAIWNIPAKATGLPEDVEMQAMPASVPGAVQCRNWFGEFGYGGTGSPANFYEFTLYALDTDDLSAEITQNSSLPEVKAALEAHSVGTATLSGQTAP